jgi:formyltetrahydrofolate synthetase
MNIKCRYSKLKPDVVVLVATVRAIKYHSGNFKVVPGKPLPAEMKKKDLKSLEKGIGNLEKQIENAKIFGIPVVVAVNKFASDKKEEIEYLIKKAKEFGAHDAVVSEVFAKGSKGGEALAEAVVKASKEKKNFKYLYKLSESIKNKIYTIATKVYGAQGVAYAKKAEEQIKTIEKNGLDKLPICMAKTHLSISDDPKLLGRPEGFEVTIRELKLAAGAGFIYPLLGKMRTMPGLPSHPNAENIEINSKGEIVGLS